MTLLERLPTGEFDGASTTAPRRAAGTPDRVRARGWLDGLLQRKSRRLLAGRWIDALARPVPGRICFVTRGNVPVCGNLRIMLDAVADLARHEVALFKDGAVDADTAAALRAKGVTVFDGFSAQALWFVHTSQTVVLSHSPRDAYLTRRRPGRRVINLWHGVALKRIEALMPEREGDASMHERRKLILGHGALYDAVLASSAVDRLVNSAAFNVPLDTVHAIGLPRYDYLRADWPLPADLQRQQASLQALLGGRRLVLYAPTFREGLAATPFAELSGAVLEALRAWCARERIVLGLRPHPYQREVLQALCDGVHIVSLNDSAYPEPAILLREAAALVVDYSSIWVDYLLTGRPIVGYVPDYEHYLQHDRGFIYDPAAVFPGPLHRHWAAVQAELQAVLDHGLAAAAAQRLAASRAWLMTADVSTRAVTPQCLPLIVPTPEPTPR